MAEDIFRDRGLKIEKGTLRQDFSKDATESVHITASQDSETRIKVFQDPGSKRDYQNLEALYKRLHDQFPHPEIPGYVDLNRAKAKLVAEQTRLMDLDIDPKTSKPEYEARIQEISDAISLLNHMQNDGLPYIFTTRFKDKVPRLIDVIQSNLP